MGSAPEAALLRAQPRPVLGPTGGGVSPGAREGLAASLASPDPLAPLVSFSYVASTSGPVPGDTASAPGQASGLGFPLQAAAGTGPVLDRFGELGLARPAEKTA